MEKTKEEMVSMLKTDIPAWNAFVLEQLKNDPSWVADIAGANLAWANLMGASLAEANLERADLTETYLTGADLSGAKLNGADLRGAKLEGAKLNGTNLREAHLNGINIIWAEGISAFGPMPTSGRMIYAVRYEGCVMVHAGCFWGTVAELRAAVIAKHNDPTYLLVCDLIEKWTFRK